jgi:RIO-like serine/threonine protein kinase
MLDYNMKYSPITDNPYFITARGLDMERWTWLVAFRQNCVKLAWAFISIMNVIHHCGISYNDLSKYNIMLHFSINKPNVVYISLRNWGEARCLQKVTPSMYGYAKEQDATNTKNKK